MGVDIEVAEKDQRSVPWGAFIYKWGEAPYQVSDGPSHHPSGYHPNKSRGGIGSTKSE